MTLRRLWNLCAAALALLVFVLVVGPAHAGAQDSAALAAVQKIMSTDFANANFGDAKRKLRAELDKCKAQSCAGGTVAQIDVALGMVSTAIGRADEAKASYTDALDADPTATLPATGVTDAMKAQFADAKKVWDEKNAKIAPPGWKSREAFDLLSAGVVAEQAGQLDVCIAKDKASLAIEEQMKTRLHVAGCEKRAGKFVDALRDANAGLQEAIKRNDTASMNTGRSIIEDLAKRLAHVVFVPPAGVDKVQVQFDDRPVPPEMAGKQFTVDPGKHKVHAEAFVGGTHMVFDQTYDVAEGQLVNVQITLRPFSGEFLTQGQLICLREAKNQEDVIRCLPSETRPLVVRVGADMSAYTDTTAVRVYTPGVHAQIDAPTQGWNVGGSYLVDIVSAASPDVVSTASRRFTDTRHAGVLHGGYKPGRYGADALASLSVENDYVSRTFGIGGTGDFWQQRITERLGFTYSHDTIGRAGTPYSVFSNTLDTYDVESSTTFVLTPISILVVGGSVELQRGDQSKPYRLIPLFDDNTTVPIGASIATVNQSRLPVRPFEQLPLDRDRYALAARYARRGDGGTLRLEERLYYDSWQMAASTSDFRYIFDFGERLRAWPHVHLHAQKGANFYQRVYHAEIAPVLNLPTFRTTDRELSPLISITGGTGFRYSLSSQAAKVRYYLNLTDDVMYTRFLNALYVRNRLAVYGTLGLEAEFD